MLYLGIVFLSGRYCEQADEGRGISKEDQAFQWVPPLWTERRG